MVADFGIALAVGAAGSNRLTETGLSLGTPYYMSPEQATGDQVVGASTDTYALGSVLYEMLVGEPPYPGTTAQAVLGRIIAGKPVSATEQRASIPANVDAAVRKALEKLPADRFASAQEFVRALGDEHFRYGQLATAGASAAVGPWNRLTMATTMLAALFAIALGWALLRPEPPGLLARFSLAFEGGLAEAGVGMEFTPDASALVYEGRAESGEGSQLWMRRWPDLDASPIRGTEIGRQVSFALSPDGREVAFAPLNGPLRVVSLDGGTPRTLVEERVGLVSDWAPDGTVYFTETGGLMLRRVPATAGGTDAVETVTELLDRETRHGNLQVLPGGRMAVFQVWYAPGGVDAEIWVMDLDTQERRFLISGHSPRYASTGHLLFGTPAGVLMAAPFDPGTAELTADPVGVADGLRTNPIFGIANYDIFRNGSLVYAGGASSSGAPMMWVSRNGSEEVLDPAFTGLFEAPSFSPDGRRVAVQRQVGGAPEDIWIYDFDQETFTRLTFEGRNLQPFWNPDGTEVGFSSNREGAFALYARPVDLSSETRLLVAAGDAPGLYTAVWTPDWLIYRRGSATTDGTADLWYVAPHPDSTPVAFLETPYPEYSPSISPDGRWLAYQSNESGQFEVYVRPFPGPGGQSQVSVNGGRNAVWARSEREIYYISSDLSLTVATFRTDPTFAVESRQQLTSWPYRLGSPNRDYDLTPDDQRFLAVAPTAAEAQGQLILVQNFFEELRQVVAN